VACPILVPKKWLTIRRARSIPAETPAEVNIGSSKVNRRSSRILAVGAAPRKKSKVLQWVVASRPSNKPAFPRRLEPVHTEAVSLVLVAWAAIYFMRVLFFTSLRVPQPPGTISKSRTGQSSIVMSGVKRRPPTAETWPFLSEIKRIRNGDDSCRRRSSFKRVIENTSKGPETSKTSTWSKIRIPTVSGKLFCFITQIYPLFAESCLLFIST